MGLCEDMLVSLEEFPEEDWNIETKCYVVGLIDQLYIKGFLTFEESEILTKKIPITQEELSRINW
ncbi:MAG: hypothetical protein N3A67_09870 [Ignavibacteria bacterium]|jgi:hypothetical protein|nr:hypothetical protein [Ignavibacteria bacterium]